MTHRAIRSLAVALFSLAAPAVVSAQEPSLGSLIGTFRFFGCDIYVCDALTVRTYEALNDVSPYRLLATGTITAKPLWFLEQNGTFDAAHSVAPFPFEYMSDWDDGDTFFIPGFTSAEPTRAYSGSLLRIDDPIITGASVKYLAYVDEYGSREYRYFQLTAVPTVTTPEPATFALVAGGLALVGVAGCARRGSARRRIAQDLYA